jgi:hypothetical protein
MLILSAYTLGTLFLNITIVDLYNHSMSSNKYHKKEKILEYIRVCLTIHYLLVGLVAQVLISSHISLVHMGHAFDFRYALLLFIWVVMFWIQVSFFAYHTVEVLQIKVYVKKRVPFAKKEYMSGKYYLYIPRSIVFNRCNLMTAVDFCYGGCELAKQATEIVFILSAISAITIFI